MKSSDILSRRFSQTISMSAVVGGEIGNGEWRSERDEGTKRFFSRFFEVKDRGISNTVGRHRHSAPAPTGSADYFQCPCRLKVWCRCLVIPVSAGAEFSELVPVPTLVSNKTSLEQIILRFLIGNTCFFCCAKNPKEAAKIH